jgi:hypothetical protein
MNATGQAAVSASGLASVRKTGKQVSKSVKANLRVRSGSLRELPTFVIIGSQRSGTTSLYSWLSSHPAIAPATQKEMHYFDGKNYERGMEWYRAQFPLRRPGRITGESTPHMLYNPLSAERAAKDLPDTTRFIVLLRNPVERAISHYWLSRRSKAESEELGVAIGLEYERLAPEEAAFQAGKYSYAHHKFSYASRGHYAGQLRRWYQHVDPKRILVLQSESLFNDPTKVNTVTDWLGLAPMTDPMPALNSAVRSDTDQEVVAQLRERFEEPNRDLSELLERPVWG